MKLLIDSFDGGFNENDRIVTEDFEMESFGVTILGDVLQEDGESKFFLEVQVDTPEGYIYDLILLEESDGINPMYIALEDSMTEEVDVGAELELSRR